MHAGHRMTRIEEFHRPLPNIIFLGGYVPTLLLQIVFVVTLDESLCLGTVATTTPATIVSATTTYPGTTVIQSTGTVSSTTPASTVTQSSVTQTSSVGVTTSAQTTATAGSTTTGWRCCEAH